MDTVITGNNVINLRERGKISIASASLTKGVMTDDTAKYKIVSAAPIDIKINSTIDIFGKTYRVNNKPEWTKTAENSYAYDVTFEGVMYDLRKCMMFNADGTGFKTDSDFSLIGTIEVFLLCLRNNIVRLSENWEIGTFQNNETKTITFSKDNCLSALQKICQEFKVEFRIDNANGLNVINVGNFGQELDYAFEYGKGNGLYELQCTNVDENGIINRMYVAGGSENLPNDYQNFSTTLKLPGGVDYLENAESIALLGLKEGFIDFPDIYPHRTGVISAIDANKKVFFDDSMDFDLNEKETDGITTKYLKPDTTAKVHFNTGNLAGYEFEIKKGGYDHATKKFEIIPFQNEQGLKFPNDDTVAFQFQVGDEYVIIDIYYPETYITNAENELLAKANEQFPLQLQPKVNYKLKVDENYLKTKVDFPEEVPFDLGDTVQIIDIALGVDKQIKIVGFTRDLLNPFKYDIEIADSYEINFASQVLLDIIGINNTVTNQSSVIKQNYLNGYRRLNELQDLTFDTDGYFDTTRIKPLSIETNMLSVGSRSQQLTLQEVVIEPNYTSDPAKLKLSAGKLIHFSIDETVKEWNFLETTIMGLVDTEVYYLYAKCEKTGVQGEFVTDTAQIRFDSMPNYWYFLLGVLHKVNNGFRFYTPLEGATKINGRYITTGKIQSVDASTWFDLDLGAFDLGGTAGMTGNANSDVFLWGGGTYINRDVARRTMTRSGIDYWRHSNGNIGFEIGQKDDRLVFNGYSKTGAKLFELSDRGFLAVAYFPETWTPTPVYQAAYTSSTFDEATLITELEDELTKSVERMYYNNPGTPITTDTEYRDTTTYTLPQNLQAFEYYNGTHPDNAAYDINIGFKNTGGSRTDNVPDGWYCLIVGIVNEEVEWNSNTPPFYEFQLQVDYLSAGKVTQSKFITITK